MAPDIVGESRRIRQAVALADRYAKSRLPVLLVGATGTGKELFAQHIHAASGRHGPLVDVDCGALPREMLESLMFGHKRGAFTGALEETEGLVARAAGGTLFLDELPSLPAEGQVKLLRLLETGQMRRLGETTKRDVDFRLIAAVQDDVLVRLESGSLRKDLYHRVAGAIIILPSLVEREGDVAILAAYFAAQLGFRLGRGALATLEGHQWAGNVRELRMVIHRAALLSEHPELDGTCLGHALAGGTYTRADELAEALARGAADPRATLLGACAANDWDPARIAESLGVSRATLYRRLRAHGIGLRRCSGSHQSHASHLKREC